jgi:hypothetical protein
MIFSVFTPVRIVVALRCRGTSEVCGLLILLVAVVLVNLSIGCGVKSPPVPPQQAVPERIVSLSADSEQNGVRLGWERPEHYAGGRKMRDLSAFEIDRAENTLEFQPLVEVPVTDQDRFQQQRRFIYLDSTAQIGHHYRYQVISLTQDAYRSTPSNEAEITRELPKPPPNPENFVLPQPKPLP